MRVGLCLADVHLDECLCWILLGLGEEVVDEVDYILVSFFEDGELDEVDELG